MLRQIDVKCTPPIVAQNDHDEKDKEHYRWNSEKIKCDDFSTVVVEKSPPRLR